MRRLQPRADRAAAPAGLAVAFGGEDKPMIEAQQQRIGDADLLDCALALLSIDKASTRARRIYRRLVDAEKRARRAGPAAMQPVSVAGTG